MADVDVIRRVYPESAEGAHFEIGPWPDAPDCLELRTVDKKSIEYFGAINITMSKDVAIAIAQALLASSADLDRPSGDGESQR